jgi:hypothetical protein
MQACFPIKALQARRYRYILGDRIKNESATLTKEHINNKGYNKYLKLQGEASIEIDYEKYNDDAKWDGLRGYMANTSLPKESFIEKCNQLWLIEKAFRISKSDLQIRPVYHHLKKRIETQPAYPLQPANYAKN